MASRECAVQRAMAQVGGNEQLAIHSILYGEVRDAATASSFAASFAAPAVSFSGPSFGFGTSFAPAEFASSSSMSTNVLSFPDHLTGRRMSLVLVADGKLQPPAQLRAQIKRALELMKTATWFFAQRSPGIKRHREEAPPPLSVDLMLTEFSPRVPVRLMFGCVAIACRRLATAPAGMHVFCKTMGRWAAWIMERVTRGRVRRVQVRLQRRACCAVRCACRASACVRYVFDACCRKRWLVFRYVAAHRSGCIKLAAAFILVCRLLLPPAFQTTTGTGLGTRQKAETAMRCFAMRLLMLMTSKFASTSETTGICPPAPSAPHLFSSFSCSKSILFFVQASHSTARVC